MIDRFPTDREFEQAAHALAAGRLVAFPTETVYGLGADATNDHAVAAIYHAKGRPRFNPLIMHVADISAAQMIGHLSEPALQLAEAFWPGPLTIVVPRRPGAKLSSLATAGLE
ncbi:MAG TPA: L-threonylcarbamoyladenylate synthase, partial [Hyphomicrobiaceae bacterium]|nr:L-threonylcarbamoyladenylate synthase [Hyphomicrobiaceae bacterium]